MTLNIAHDSSATALVNKELKGAFDHAIEVHHLVKRYHGASHNSVDDVSFEVKRGEIFGLLGPNGAGKTTTIGIMTTSIRSTSGTVRIMGSDVARDPVGAKQCIAVMPQRCNLDLSLSCREILTFHARYHGVPSAERNARADQLLKELGLEAHRKHMPRTFSGGQAQRLMLARALMHAPDVLFLDEPTNNLDPQSRLFLWEHIRALRESGVTILLTTHDMEEADQLCDRIAIMDHGQILVLDTPTNLKKVIPGGTRLDLHVYEAESVEHRRNAGNTDTTKTDESSVLASLRALPGVLKVEEILPGGEDTTQEEIYHCYAGETSKLIGPAIQAISDAGGELRNIHLAHPSLENVFIYLTGRKLRS